MSPGIMEGGIISAIMICTTFVLVVWIFSRPKSKPIEIKTVNVGKTTLDIEFKDGTIWEGFETFCGYKYKGLVGHCFLDFGKFVWEWKTYNAKDYLYAWFEDIDAATVFWNEEVGYPFHEVFKFHEHKEDHFIDVEVGSWKE